jgi:hypothetical protein
MSGYIRQPRQLLTLSDKSLENVETRIYVIMKMRRHCARHTAIFPADTTYAALFHDVISTNYRNSMKILLAVL